MEHEARLARIMATTKLKVENQKMECKRRMPYKTDTGLKLEMDRKREKAWQKMMISVSD